MDSIISVFFGVCFPHALEYNEESGRFYFLIYEPLKARHFIKVEGDIAIIENAAKTYDDSWDLETFVNQKSPIMAAVSGSMVQSEIGMSFLGPTLEEKFHVNCSSFRILPCLPLVPEILKDKVHADVSPNILQDNVKNGYFLVNLSLNQAFGAPEFSEINPNDNEEQDDYHSEDGHNQLHSDNDEIQSENEEEAQDHEEGGDDLSGNGEFNNEREDFQAHVDDDGMSIGSANIDQQYEPDNASQPFLFGSDYNEYTDIGEIFIGEASSSVGRFDSPHREETSRNSIQDYVVNHGGDSEADDLITDGGENSLGSSIYDAMESANLKSDENRRRRSTSYDSYGEGPSFSQFMSPPPFSAAPQLSSNTRTAFPEFRSTSQFNLNAHISNQHRNIKISSYFTRKDSVTQQTSGSNSQTSANTSDNCDVIENGDSPVNQSTSYHQEDDINNNRNENSIDSNSNETSSSKSRYKSRKGKEKMTESNGSDFEGFFEEPTVPMDGDSLVDSETPSVEHTRKRKSISKKDTAEKKKKKKGAYGSMEQYVFQL